MIRGVVLQVSLFTITSPNTVNILWQLPQLVLITVAEIMFSITGLVFSYSQVISQLQVKYLHVRGANYLLNVTKSQWQGYFFGFTYHIMMCRFNYWFRKWSGTIHHFRFNMAAKFLSPISISVAPWRDITQTDITVLKCITGQTFDRIRF